MTAVIYSRVSTDEQVQTGKSLEVQIDNCRRWAEQNNYTIVGIYKDEGKSATTLKGRNGLEDAIVQCQEEKVSVCLVLDTDRLCRNPSDHFLVKAALKKGGTRIIAVSQPMIDDSPEGNLIDAIMAGVNAFQSQITGRKVKKTMEKKCEMGDFPGMAKLGYSNINEGSEEKPTRVIKIDSQRGPLMTDLFKIFSTGDHSVDSMVELMYQKGLRSKSGHKVCRTVLYSCLKDPFYTGKFRYKGNIYQGNHPPLIAPEIFELNQRVIAVHNRFACRKRKYKWLLNGIAFCQDHNSRLFGDRSQARNKAYYHGSTQNHCNHYIPLESLEKEVVKQFKRIKFTDEFIERIINKVKELVKESRENKGRDVENIRNAIKQLEIKRRVLEDNLLDQTVDKETFKRKHTELDIQIQNHENEIVTIEHAGGIDLNVIADILEVAKNVGQAYEKAGFNVKRHYLSMFFQRIEISGKHIVRVVYTPLLENLIYAKGVRISSNWLPRVDSNHEPSS